MLFKTRNCKGFSGTISSAISTGLSASTMLDETKSVVQSPDINTVSRSFVELAARAMLVAPRDRERDLVTAALPVVINGYSTSKLLKNSFVDNFQ